MPIRAYFCFWSLEGNRIVNPVMNLLDPDVVIPGVQWISSHYLRAGVDGIPVKPFCMVFVKGTDFSIFNALPDVDRFPVLNLSTPIDDTPAIKQAAIDLFKNKYEVPLARFADCVTWKDVAHVILKYFNVSFKTFGNHIRDEEFA